MDFLANPIYHVYLFNHIYILTCDHFILNKLILFKLIWLVSFPEQLKVIVQWGEFHVVIGF